MLFSNLIYKILASISDTLHFYMDQDLTRDQENTFFLNTFSIKNIILQKLFFVIDELIIKSRGRNETNNMNPDPKHLFNQKSENNKPCR